MLEDTIWHFADSFAHSQLYFYKCNHRYAHTFTAHWMYNVELTFSTQKISQHCQLSRFTRNCSLSKKAKAEDENLVRNLLASAFSGRPSTVPKMFSTTVIPSRPVLCYTCSSSKLGILLSGRGILQTSTKRCASRILQSKFYSWSRSSLNVISFNQYSIFYDVPIWMWALPHSFNDPLSKPPDNALIVFN